MARPQARPTRVLGRVPAPPRVPHPTRCLALPRVALLCRTRYGQTPSKKKMEGGTARARAALEQPKAARTSKLNPSFASTVAVKDVAKDYEETYVLGNDGEMELTNGKEKVLFNLAEQAPATPVQRKMSQHSNLLIQTLTPSNSRPSTAAMLASVSPTSELEYDDSIMFSTRDDDDDDDDEAAADETAIAFPISASKGEASKRTTPPVQMVSFETPGRVSYSADYYAKQVRRRWDPSPAPPAFLVAWLLGCRANVAAHCVPCAVQRRLTHRLRRGAPPTNRFAVPHALLCRCPHSHVTILLRRLRRASRRQQRCAMLGPPCGPTHRAAPSPTAAFIPASQRHPCEPPVCPPLSLRPTRLHLPLCCACLWFAERVALRVGDGLPGCGVAGGKRGQGSVPAVQRHRVGEL